MCSITRGGPKHVVLELEVFVQASSCPLVEHVRGEFHSGGSSVARRKELRLKFMQTASTYQSDGELGILQQLRHEYLKHAIPL